MNRDSEEIPEIDKGHEIIEADFDPNELGVLEENNTTLQHNPFEEINHKLDMSKYRISGVCQDVVLGKEVEEENKGSGSSDWNVSEGGIYTSKVGSSDNQNNKILEVLMVGEDVKNFKVGDMIACALDTGIKVVDFFNTGDEVCLIREQNVFFKLERK